MKRKLAQDILFGCAVGDALGVPVEFRSRDAIALNPVKSMLGYGTHNQAPGTWSDDSSLAFCLAEALIPDFNLNLLAQNFVQWLYYSYWTPHGSVFDVGFTTRQAIRELQKGANPELAGGFDEDNNGNGSLMRILPLLLFTKDKPIQERYNWAKKVSSLTHAHARSVIACFYYLEYARLIVVGQDKFKAYELIKKPVTDFLQSIQMNQAEIDRFSRLLKGNIYDLKEKDIASSGYVIHTLEASVWCLLTTNTYANAVLKAVNFGEDTDTTGCVTGGLAGILYGCDEIPAEWVTVIARKEDIKNLANRLAAEYV